MCEGSKALYRQILVRFEIGEYDSPAMVPGVLLKEHTSLKRGRFGEFRVGAV